MFTHAASFSSITVEAIEWASAGGAVMRQTTASVGCGCMPWLSAVGDAAQLCRAGREQPSIAAPHLAAHTHEAVVGDGALVVDQQPFTIRTAMVKPCARVEVGRQVLPAAILLIGGREAERVEQDQRARRVHEWVFEACRRLKARPL